MLRAIDLSPEVKERRRTSLLEMAMFKPRSIVLQWDFDNDCIIMGEKNQGFSDIGGQHVADLADLTLLLASLKAKGIAPMLTSMLEAARPHAWHDSSEDSGVV
jgi:hypothetical protein